MQIIKSVADSHEQSRILPENPRTLIRDICKDASTIINTIFICDASENIRCFGSNVELSQYIDQVKTEYCSQTAALLNLVSPIIEDGEELVVRNTLPTFMKGVSQI